LTASARVLTPLAIFSRAGASYRISFAGMIETSSGYFDILWKDVSFFQRLEKRPRSAAFLK
jgi:hypothetical protein